MHKLHDFILYRFTESTKPKTYHKISSGKSKTQYSYSIAYDQILYYKMEERASFRQQHLFTDVALESCGFEVATNQNINRALYSVFPNGKRSCLFSAIISALKSLKDLYLMIEDSGTAQNWRLTLLVVVSDHDTGSPTNWNQVKRVYQETKSRIRVERFQVIFVAYNIDQPKYQQLFFLQNLDQFGYTPLHLASSQQALDGYQNFGQLMKRIRDSEGLGNRREGAPSIMVEKDAMRDQLQDEVKQKVKINQNPYEARIGNYGVIFAISQAEKYQGDSWRSLSNGVSTFCKYLGGQDLFGCMLFSQQCKYFMKDRFVPREQPLLAVQHPPILQPNYHQQLNAPLLRPAPPNPAVARMAQPQPNMAETCCKYMLLRILIVMIIAGIVAIAAR